MKTFVLAALTVAAPLQAQDFRIQLQQRTLPNGVQILVEERPAAGRVAARIFYTVDIATERQGLWGATHMLEHSLFKGSRFIGTSDWEGERAVATRVETLAREVEDERNRLRDVCRSRDAYVPADLEPECHRPRLDSLVAAFDAALAAQDEYTLGTDLMRVYQFAGGTNMTASTGTDFMKFHIDLPADRLELFMYVERSRMEFPVFRQFDPEREVVVDQIRRRFNRPDGQFQRDMQSLTYPAHPYGSSHWFSDLTQSQREDHWELFYKSFIPQNAIIVVVGEIEAETVFALAERYFGDWLPGRPAPRVKTIEPVPSGQRRVEASAAAGPTVAVNARIPAVGHPDLPALQVLAGVLGGPEGMLTRSLGDRATRANVNTGQRKYPGHISISVNGRSNDQLGEIETGIDEVLRSVAAGNASREDIDRAVAQLRFRRVRTFETIGGAATAIGAMQSIYRWDYINEEPELWAAVTPDDLARVTAEYLRPDRRVVGVLRRERVNEAVASWQENAAAQGHPAWDAAVGGVTVPALPEEPEMATGTEMGEREGWSPPVTDRAVWWAPPWMPGQAVRFTGSDVPDDYRDITFPSTRFETPHASDFRSTFRNGLRAYVAQDPSLPIVKITAMVDLSSLDDPAGQEGLTSLTVNGIRFGGTGDMSPDDVESELARLGASLSASSGRDVARFELTAPASSGEDALRLMASLLNSPGFGEGRFERSRARAAVQADRATDDPREQLERSFEEALYGDSHPMSARPSRESVESISRHDIQSWHRSQVTPERTVFAVSGSIERGSVETVLADVYSTRTGGGNPSPRDREMPSVQEQNGPGVITVQRSGMRQAHVLIGHMGIEGVQSDQAALELMHYTLAGGGFASRMMDLLRTQTGITAALFGRVEPGLGGSYPYLWRFSGNPQTIARGVRLAVAQITDMRDNGVTAEELENARTAYMEGLVPATFDTPQKTVTKLAYRDLLGRYPYTAVQYLNYYAADGDQIEDISNVSLDDVNRAARSYLHPEDLVVVVVGDLDVIREGATEAERDLLGLNE